MLNFLKKLENKFIYIIILLIIIVLWFSILWSNDNKSESFWLIVSGEWFINDSKLELHKRVELESWDTFKTVWKSSMWVIEWWDWSITRLWWDSEIHIREADISMENNIINIWFELLDWKTWSNVISFMSSDSYFVEYFSDTEAAVRWTVFNIDFISWKKDWSIQVNKHEISLTKWWKNFIVWEWKPVSIKTLDVISEKFTTSLEWLQWTKKNLSLDNKYLDKLKSQLWNIDDIKEKLNQSINDMWGNISSLSTESKKELYNKLLSQYQKINFISAEDWEFFKQKQLFKSYLLNLWTIEDKKNIFKYSIYDLKDSIKLKSVDWINEVMTLIWNNFYDFKNLWFNFKSINFDGLAEDQLQKIYKHIDSINSDMLDVSDYVWKVLLENIKDVPNNFMNTTDDIINNIDDTINNTNDSIKWFMNIKINN